MVGHDIFLLLAALSSIVVLVLLIGRLKLHPFIALLVVSVALGLAIGMSVSGVLHSFETGVGNTLGHVAVVVALGTILGKMVAESGGAERIATTLIRRFGERNVPWAMLLIGLIVGTPVFFEVGFVLLMPIAFSVARRTKQSLVLVALPMVTGLSVVHAFIPPHPAAMAAVILYHADLGRTIALALVAGLPAAVLAGPLYARWVAPRVRLHTSSAVGDQLGESHARKEMPSFGVSVFTILLPVCLMLAGGWADALARPGSAANSVLHFTGGPDGALLVGVLVSFLTLGWRQGMTREHMLRSATESLPPTAGALFLIGAGGGFGRILQDGNISQALVAMAQRSHLHVLVMAWLLAALIRVGTGSSTVAMMTAAGVMAPLAPHLPGLQSELLVVATGAGSIVLSHVNDGGFWLVKEYLGLSVPETLKTWTICETILSVAGLAVTLVLARLF